MVMVQLNAARRQMRKQIEDLYEGTCTIYTYENVYNTATHSLESVDKVFAEDEPCRLSYLSSGPADQSETANIVGQDIYLFLAPEIKARAGSVVKVTQNCVTRTYESMGISAMYFSHQEVKLKLKKTEA